MSHSCENLIPPCHNLVCDTSQQGVAITWAVGEVSEKFSSQQAEVVQRTFCIVGLSLPIDGSEDTEISIKGLLNEYLVEGLKEWEGRGAQVEERVEMEEKTEAEAEAEAEVEVGAQVEVEVGAQTERPELE
ncbi:hypothetical protein HOY82DRAFT_615839 [Tuber indicum]|nr:hypothetical protein HOY82DRAFT_615839 [Tuber indicum]